ncbi:MAG: hypothetical protein QMD22_10515 [archaeon]|nr:hypothetical protein [archaeon]
MMKPNLVEVSCIDCGHVITLNQDQMEQHLEELGWKKKGAGWQCPHCYFFTNKEEGRDNRG